MFYVLNFDVSYTASVSELQYLFLLQSEVWPDYGKNQESVGSLWLGFFRYFFEEFNFTEHVITIRQTKLLTKFEKLWNGKCIAIEG